MSAAERAGAGPPVLTERRGAVLLLTLNRPDRLNAVSLPMYQALLESLAQLDADDGLRAAVVTGAGRSFCVGADLKAHDAAEPTDAERRAYIRTAQRANARVQTCGKPVIAAVNGHAIGGGLELALSCDLILVADTARLRFPELAIGTFVGGGVSYTLERRVGYTRARELLFLADFFTGETAAAFGLANLALPAAHVLDTALEWAGRVARLAPVPTRMAKRLFMEAPFLTRGAVLSREARALHEIMQTDDWKEGLRAFHEKRDPHYTGR